MHVLAISARYTPDAIAIAMDMDMDALAFARSDELPNDVGPPAGPVIQTVVNTKPLQDTPFVAPFVPCSPPTVAAALDFAAVAPGDTLLDLGCGDARILFHALAKHPTLQCVGVELDPLLAQYISQQIHARHLSKHFAFIPADMYTIDITELGATVAILYLLTPGIAKLKPLLSTWLNAVHGSRVVTVTYAIPDWQPADTMLVTGTHTNPAPRLFKYTSESIR
ncbi:hypothetical protein SeMB42_g02538 [Synchytrium endobioticum]|uniref:Methyltransferase domain-containing protein n=1 Tax=Synchytrium endobioticum TaxID=286115 RepID=A0A507DEB9_9FUNG|nr:hypothetical protein SeMB42_g02538 [Synchytrium endobioticum]